MPTNIENPSTTQTRQAPESEPEVQQPDALQSAIEAEEVRLMQPGAVISHAHANGETKSMTVKEVLNPGGKEAPAPCLGSLSEAQRLRLMAMSNVLKTFDLEKYKSDLDADKSAPKKLQEQASSKEPQEKSHATVNVAEKPMPLATPEVIMQLQRRAFEEQVVVIQIAKPEVVIKKMTTNEPKIESQRIAKRPVVTAAARAPKLEQIVAVKSALVKSEVVVTQPLKPDEQHKDRSIVEKVEMLTIPPIAAPEHVIENDFEPMIIQEQFAVTGIENLALAEAVTAVESQAVAIDTAEIEAVAEFIVAEAEPMIFEEAEALEFAEGDETVPVTAQLLRAFLAPNRQHETAGEQVEAAALVSEVVIAFLQELAPEQLVEIEAQIEQIILVADRLHFLVENDAGDCEEALLIDAFLARKFSELLTEIEPILEALSITIDDETIAAFITFVRSDKYQSKADLLANFIEIQSEGTHEKKLFKEASVFKKAQHASQIWQQNMQSMLGRITLNNAA